ncbi:transposase [Streptomyces sp. NPDC050287]|uniref:transposase n=1 Tax=Streptomyces sp. NPDC050287 TaxID=3365608 RepID=UPI0037A00A86
MAQDGDERSAVVTCAGPQRRPHCPTRGSRPGAGADLVADLVTIPGIGVRTAQTLLAELCPDMTVFPTADHLVSRAKFAPRTVQSGGKNTSDPTVAWQYRLPARRRTGISSVSNAAASCRRSPDEGTRSTNEVFRSSRRPAHPGSGVPSRPNPRSPTSDHSRQVQATADVRP